MSGKSTVEGKSGLNFILFFVINGGVSRYMELGQELGQELSDRLR